MSTIANTLAGFKTVLASVDASPQRNADYIYAWPDDSDQIATILHQSEPSLPVIVVQRDMSGAIPVQRYHLNAIKHLVPYEINVYLREGQLRDIEEAAAIVEIEPDWIKAMSTALSANRSISNTALTIGNDEGLFSYQSGHIHFAESRLFWGIRFVVFVHQEIV